MDKEKEKEKEKQELNKEITDPVEEKKERKRELERELKKAEGRAKKRKLIPPFVMLLAGAVAGIAMFALHYRAKDRFFLILFCVLLVFYIAGGLFKWMLDRFERQIDDKRREEVKAIEEEINEAKIKQAAEAEAAAKAKVEKKKKEYADEELLF